MKTKIVGLKDLRENIDSWINKVSRGESFLVMRKSAPVFKIVPAEEDEQWETVADFTEIHKNGVSGKDILRALRKLNA
ncbi:MAG: type II toxin-antitoxin system Phd/YefM family antitoxin [Candidatus Vogelbacteria bacterium]|nr:type II toxin-antitoxin system Phd/YefM family antitoxin [Candidatus Vogelbacteria bacterium]